jgi:hypothetical protein
MHSGTPLLYCGVLEVTGDASRLAEAFIEHHALPAKAAVDALHIAVAVVMGMDYVPRGTCLSERVCR